MVIAEEARGTFLFGKGETGLLNQGKSERTELSPTVSICCITPWVDC